MGSAVAQTVAAHFGSAAAAYAVCALAEPAAAVGDMSPLHTPAPFTSCAMCNSPESDPTFISSRSELDDAVDCDAPVALGFDSPISAASEGTLAARSGSREAAVATFVAQVAPLPVIVRFADSLVGEIARLDAAKGCNDGEEGGGATGGGSRRRVVWKRNGSAIGFAAF